MNKFEELFDDILYKAKNVADAAGKKTGEVVGISKLKYQVKQTQWDIEKAYAKLGAFVYESKKSDEDFTDLIELAVNEIELLNSKLDDLEQEILACKRVVKCSGCGKENELTSSFCSRCGGSLEDEKKEAEATEEAAEMVEEAVEAAEKAADAEKEE